MFATEQTFGSDGAQRPNRRFAMNTTLFVAGAHRRRRRVARGQGSFGKRQGMYYGDRPIVGLLANNYADVGLHVAIAIVALYLGFAMKAATPASR